LHLRVTLPVGMHMANEDHRRCRAGPQQTRGAPGCGGL